MTKIPDHIWAIVDKIAEPFGETKTEHAQCVDRLRCALAERLAADQAWLDARDAEFDDRWNARMNP